ncbi:hypothetical protein ACJX0J_006702 [Zea mays]
MGLSVEAQVLKYHSALDRICLTKIKNRADMLVHHFISLLLPLFRKAPNDSDIENGKQVPHEHKQCVLDRDKTWHTTSGYLEGFDSEDRAPKDKEKRARRTQQTTHKRVELQR